MAIARDRDSFKDGSSDADADYSEPSQAVPASPKAEQARGPGPEFDRRLVMVSFAHMMADSAETMKYLYGRLFAANPELRMLFPLAMGSTRAAAFRMLAKLVWSLDNPRDAEPILTALARDHRKFGVKEKHYQPFLEALLATAEHVAGPAWTAQMDQAWRGAAAYIAAVMGAAAASDARSRPAWWLGEIVQHEQRTETIAVLTIKPDRSLDYRPGQYISVQLPRWPRVWRSYSVANAPRDNGLIDIHVRSVPRGLLSTSMVGHSVVGDTLVLGPARGEMAQPADGDRAMVCIAGGTGLAPIKAIIEAVVAEPGSGRRPPITLYFGARRRQDLYDMRDLETLSLACPAMTLIPVVESESGSAAKASRLADLVREHSSFRDTDVYVSGPAGLVASMTRILSGRVPNESLHHDPLDALQGARRPQGAE